MNMHKYFTFNALAAILIPLMFTLTPVEKEITLEAQILGCGNVMHLYQFDGFGFSLLQSAQNAQQNFTFQLTADEPGFYYIGPSERNAVPLILGDEQQVTVRGNCGQLRQLEFVDSPINDAYRELKAKMEDFNRQNTQLQRNLQRERGADRKEEMLNELKALDEERLAFLQQQEKDNPLFGTIVALNTYLSYPHNGQEYDSEIGYFADNFFRFADFTDENYGKSPWTYESFKGYATTLSSVGLPDDLHKHYMEKALAKIPTPSRAKKMAYAGMLSALKQKNHTNYIYFSDQFIEAFRATDPELTSKLKKELEDARNLMVGGVAPDFTQESPDGQDISLSDLRGKVLLLDFWASWCGPCRRENPNVVRVYKKYKEKGFDILSVSLDKTRDRWLQAIEQDEMTWHHVSDLKGWQNEVAQAYGVHSIPQTILLDADGKILARNLRGAQLEQKLAELFGQ